jgi:hypothetical protein
MLVAGIQVLLDWTHAKDMQGGAMKGILLVGRLKAVHFACLI